MRAIKMLLLGALVIALASPAGAVGLAWLADLDPRFREPLADPYAARFAALFLATDRGEYLYRMNLGGELGIVRPEFAQPGWTLDGRMLIAGRFNYSLDSFPLENADFEGGLVFNLQAGGDQIEIYGYHRSSHLGGDVVERGWRVPSNVSAEYMRALYFKTWTSGIRMYLGPSLMVHADPPITHLRPGAQAGLEWEAGPWGAGVDVKIAELANPSPDAALQLGYRISPAGSQVQQWFQLFFYSGHSLAGQFQGQREILAGMGMMVRIY